MDHLQRVQQEFTRQAGQFATAAAVTRDDLVQRFVDAVPVDANAVVLDAACGPGIITAVLAPRVREVAAFDLTPEMLTKARQRCAAAGLTNVSFREGSATAMPFADASFDAVMTRLSLHHFQHPRQPVTEMARVLKPGGVLVVADVSSSEVAEESELHNAIEILRDPSHVRMLPEPELLGLIRDAGLTVEHHTHWDEAREFEEWARIVDDPQRIGPIRTVVHTLARLGQHAGTGWALADRKIVFFHRWHLIVARKTP
ncbi:MAG TPA: methyltransferase domain-containing protein [Acetobacteraceae bacterium]|jgi:ubiquinone/menaquinone biosynthesis C-methylase UbiE